MGKPLLILFVTYEYPNKNGEYGGSGIATTYYELTQGLARLGHEIWVLTHAVDKESSYMDHKVHVWRIPSDPIRSDTYDRIRSRSKAVAKAIASLMKKKSFDIIQFPEFNAEGYDFFKYRKSNSLLKQPKIVVRLHSSSKPYKKLHNLLTKDEELILKLEKSMLHHCDLVISPCKATWHAVKVAMNVQESQRVVYIPNAINSDYFLPASRKLNQKPFVFGFTGKLSHAKGVATIIAAFASLAAQLDDVELKLIGRAKSIVGLGDYYKWLVKDLPPAVSRRIHHLNYIPRKELVPYYQSFDAFVFASRNENFPNTVMEAMSCGLPVIASNVGGVPELLGKKNTSLQFEYLDTPALMKAMLKVYTDQTVREHAGRYNRERIVNQFSTPIILKQCENTYRHLRSKG